MKIVRSKEFRADRAWGALDIAKMNGITTRLHWTDQPYRWHVNDGEEVFAVLDGQVEMRYRQDGQELRTLLDAELKANGGSPNARCNESTTGTLRFFAMARMLSRSAAEPPICTGMMAAVRSVIAVSSLAGSIWNVSRSESTKTGMA